MFNVATLGRAIAAVAPDCDEKTWANAFYPFLMKRRFTTARRAALLIGQCAVEFGFKPNNLTENMMYSASRLCKVWPSRFPTLESAKPYEYKPEKLAEHVYGGRMGNRPEGSGDGWDFRGAGPSQITGRTDHTKLATKLGIPVEDLGNYISSPVGAADAATWDFVELKLAENYGDSWQLTKASERLNGGLTALAERIRLCSMALGVLDPTDIYGIKQPDMLS